jgi:hypothetical protein
MKNKKTEIKREYYLGEEREDRTDTYLGDFDYYIFTEVVVTIENKKVSAKCRCGYHWSNSKGLNFATTYYDLCDLIDVDNFPELVRMFRVIRKGKLGRIVDKKSIEHQELEENCSKEGKRNSISHGQWVTEEGNADDYQEKYTELVRELLSEKIRSFKL